MQKLTLWDTESIPNGQGHWGCLVTRPSSAGKVTKDLNASETKEDMKV